MQLANSLLQFRAKTMIFCVRLGCFSRCPNFISIKKVSIFVKVYMLYVDLKVNHCIQVSFVVTLLSEDSCKQERAAVSSKLLPVASY